LNFKPYPKIYYDYIIDDKDHFVVDWLKEYKKIKVLFCDTFNEFITPTMKDFFFMRTENHINSVINYIQKFLSKSSEYLVDSYFLNDKFHEHDLSKYLRDEISPYVLVTWNYHCKDCGLDFYIPDYLKNAMRVATEHHIRENPHHPEYWCSNKYDRDLIAKDERDKFDPNSMQIVDATSMPTQYLIEMCADWCATGQERRNTPFEWTDKVINHRWKFSEQQVDFIYKVLKDMWGK